MITMSWPGLRRRELTAPLFGHHTRPLQSAAPSKAKNSKVKSSANVESEEEDGKDVKSAPASKSAGGTQPTADGEGQSTLPTHELPICTPLPSPPPSSTILNTAPQSTSLRRILTGIILSPPLVTSFLSADPE